MRIPRLNQEWSARERPMKRLLFVLPIALIAAFLAASPAQAAPSPISVGIGSHAQFQNAGQLLLPVTYNCPTSAVSAAISANIFEESTGGTSFIFSSGEPCTGSNTTVVLFMGGGPFTIGKAFATATAIGAGTFQTDQRQIQITL
jgi:hypothetical protein